MPTEPIDVQVHISINGGTPETIGTIALRERETWAWETAALLRELADTIEAQQPTTLFSLDRP